MKKRSINYSYIITIVHGKSEFKIVEFVYQTIKQPNKNIYARKRGKEFNSIQINGLPKILNSYPFNSLDNLTSHFSNINVVAGKPKNLKIAIIMDTDDCTYETKERYLNKDLFKRHYLYDYILPIHNTENLEDALKKASVEVPKSKREDYSKIFPTRGLTNLEAIQNVNDKLKTRPMATNLPDFFDYCLNNKLK